MNKSMWNPTDFTEYENLYKKEVQALNIHRKAMEQSMLAYTEHARRINAKTKPSQRPYQSNFTGFLTGHRKNGLGDPLEYTFPLYQKSLQYNEDLFHNTAPKRSSSETQLYVGRPLSRLSVNGHGSRPNTDMDGMTVSPRKLFPISSRRSKLGVFKNKQERNGDDIEDQNKDVLVLDRNDNSISENYPTLKYDWGKQRNLQTMSVMLHEKLPKTEKTLLVHRRPSLKHNKASKKSRKSTLQNSPQEKDHIQAEKAEDKVGAVTRMEEETKPVETSSVPQIQVSSQEENLSEGINSVDKPNVVAKVESEGTPAEISEGNHPKVVKITPSSASTTGCKTPTLVIHQTGSKIESNQKPAISETNSVKDEQMSENPDSEEAQGDDTSEDLTSAAQLNM